MFKVGDIVEIFEDPITCEKPEGKAQLLEFHKEFPISRDTVLEGWVVRFLDDNSVLMRKILRP